MFWSCSCAAQAGARQVHALPTACLRCCRAKSTSTGAVPGGDGGQAGVVPGHGEEAVSRPWHCSPALQPNHLLSWLLCSPGISCGELARGQSRATAPPLAPAPWGAPSQGAGFQEHRTLGKQMPHASAPPVSSPCTNLAVPALGCQWLLREEAGSCGASAALQGKVRGVGRAPRSPPWFGNRPDQFPGAFVCASLPTALASQGPAGHTQPYLFTRSCLQELLASGQSALWCFAADSSVPGAVLGCRGTEHESCPSPEQTGKGGATCWLDVPGCIGLH